jgi:hypothetical protein
MLRELHKRLRPMGFADILDEAIELDKKNFVLLVGVGAFLYVPLALLQLVTQDPGADRMASDPGAFGTYIVKAVGVILLYWLAAMFVTGALTFATSEIYLGHKTSVLACYRRVAKPSMFFRFIGASLLYGLALSGASMIPVGILVLGGVMIGTGASGMGVLMVIGVLFLFLGVCAFAIPAYVASRYAVYTPAFFVEGHGAISSMSRSWELLKGKVLSTFGILLVVSLIVLAIKSIILSPFYIPMIQASMSHAEPSAILTGVYTLLASALDAIMMPISSMAAILIYYDARIRKEGFDLEMLAAEMDQRRERVVGQGPPPLPHEAVPQNPPSQEAPGAGEQG